MKTITLKDGTNVFLKFLTVGDISKLCKMLWSLTDETRMFYHDFVVFNFNTFIRRYFGLLLNHLLNSFEYKRRGTYFLGVVALNNSKQAIGFAHLDIRSYGFFSFATYGIVVRENYQGKGLGEVLTSYTLEYGKKLKLNTITLTVATTNEKAIRLYKKYGFVIEGLHKRIDVWKDKVLDAYYMALHLNGYLHSSKGKRCPSITIGGHSKGDHPITRSGLQQVRNIAWEGERKYIWVAPDDGVSERPILDIFPKDKLVLLKDKCPSTKYKGINLIAQAWQQIQENLDTDFYLFVDNDLIRIPPDLIYSLMKAKIKWDIIGPLTTMPEYILWKLRKYFGVMLHEGKFVSPSTFAHKSAESRTADCYPFKVTDVYEKYLRMEGFCMCWLAHTPVFKSVKITNPDPYYTTFRKLNLLGYSIFMDPTINCEHAPLPEHRPTGSPFWQTVQLNNWNLKEIVALGYMTQEDLDYYYAWIGKPNPIGEETAKSDLTKYKRGDKYWEKFRRSS